MSRSRPAGRADVDPPVLRPAALLALAVSAFVYVTAETMPVGLLPQIAGGLSVSEADVGLLLTSYAAVAGLSTIPLTALTMRIPRRRLMAGLVAVYAVSQAAAALAPSFGVLMASRLLCALAHGIFWSAIAPIAARLAPPGQSGRATSLVFVGNAAALVLGVPLATALGQFTGWRTAFAVMAVAGVLSTASLLVVLPPLPPLARDLAAGVGTRLRTATTVIRSRGVFAVCLVTLVLMVGQFAAYTYIAPLVRLRGGFEGLSLSALLLGYGAAGVAGNLVVGHLVDRRPGQALAACVVAVTAALSSLWLLGGGVATVVAVLVWGAGFAAVPVCLQAAVLRVAPKAQDAASAVYVVAFQIGIGGGAFIGNRLVAAGHLGLLPGFAAGFAVVTVAIVLIARHAFPPRTPLARD